MCNTITIKKKNITYEINYSNYKLKGIDTFKIDAQEDENNDFPMYIYIMDNKLYKKSIKTFKLKKKRKRRTRTRKILIKRRCYRKPKSYDK